MTDLTTFTQPFVGSPELRVSQESQIVTIRKTHKHRWAYNAIVIFMCSFFVLLMGFITIKAIQADEPLNKVLGNLVPMVLIVVIFYALRSTMFSREVLTINLNEQTIIVEKSRRKHFQYHFDEVKQWLLVGEVSRQYRGGQAAMTQLYLQLKGKPANHKSEKIFIFYPTVDFKTTFSADYMNQMKKSAKAKGQEVAERLQSITKISWRWKNY